MQVEQDTVCLFREVGLESPCTIITLPQRFDFGKASPSDCAEKSAKLFAFQRWKSIAEVKFRHLCLKWGLINSLCEVVWPVCEFVISVSLWWRLVHCQSDRPWDVQQWDLWFSIAKYQVSPYSDAWPSRTQEGAKAYVQQFSSFLHDMANICSFSAIVTETHSRVEMHSTFR